MATMRFPPIAALLCAFVARSGAAVLFDAPGHAAPAGAAVAAAGGEPGTAWTLLDWRGRDTGIEGMFDANGAADLPPLPAGYYRMIGGRFVETALSDSGRFVETPLPGKAGRGAPTARPQGSVLATLAVLRPAMSRSFFGADCGISELWREFDCPWNGGDAARTVADLAALAGFSHIRERMHWSALQRSPDTPPEVSRHAANAALFRDRGIGVSDIFIGTPKWASPLRRLPGDLAALFRGCRDMAAAFGDTVEDWEFWNEPDIHFAPEPVWDFAAAQKAAYLGFKAARPEIPVAMAGLCQPPDGLYLKTLLANGVAPYFDIFNYHTYAPVSQYPSFFATMRKTLAEAGAGDRPIWITESGTNLEGPAALESVRPGFKAHSPDQELVVAEFFAKSQIAMQMAGMERNFAFLLGAYSERDGTKDWGLLRRDGTVKPAYAALATITHELGGATLAGALDVGPGARAYLYDHPDGTQTVAFWAESPIDTATAGHSVVEATPDFARELRLGTEGVARSPNPLRLVDLCGMEMPAPEPTTDDTLLLHATRFPAYLSGLRGLCADVPGRDAPTARPKDSGRFVETPLPGPSPIVFRVTLAPGDFDISNRKTLAIAKGAEPRLTVQIWNLSAAATTGTVAAAGAVLEGLPGAPVAIAPFEKAEFDCVLKPAPPGSPDASSTLVISGDFGGRSASPLAMPVLFENVFLASCAATPLDWKDPGAWLRNDSASSYSVRWDGPEQALRFDVAWDDPRVGRWFYPVLPLPAAGQNLDGAVRVAFEVKTAQDKAENDFGECCLMLVRGEKGGSPGEWLSYSPPTGSWERRYVELSAARDLHEVDAIRIGANPRGMKMTFWIRNIEIMKPAKPAAATLSPAPLRVALTFDDSLKDHLLIAAPMLEERGWRGTFCIVTDSVGKDERHLSWDDVRELVRRGHEIATHTKSHKDLVTLLETGREAEARREMLASVDRLVAETGVAPRFLFTPYLRQNAETARIARECGLCQTDGPRYNFGSNNCDRVTAFVGELRTNGVERADILSHGVSAADHGGWCPFPDRDSFRRHLDAIAELEKRGEIIVTDYDGMASCCALKAAAWPHHGVVSLSFDDQSFDQWEAAFPLFAKYDARATFFMIGTNRLDFAKKALAAGHEIGLHGLNHRNAPLTGDEREEEWFWKTDVAPQLAAFAEAGVPVRSYAYPNCRRNERTDALLASRGFARVRGLCAPFPPNPNPFDPKGEKLDEWRPVASADAFFLPATDFLSARLVPNVIMGEAYHTDIDDTLRAIARAGERAEALFLVSHGIAPDAKGISMKTEWLERILSSANDLGVVVRGIR